VKGIQHYRTAKLFNRESNLEESQGRDTSKEALCKEKGSNRCYILVTLLGITFVEIPFWWDRKFESLATTLYSIRPDAFKESPKGSPIPLIQPKRDSSLQSNDLFLAF
jgi:hypothetical protein